MNGLGTDWQASAPPVVELGAGVTVDSVEVTGPGTLLVSLHTDAEVDVGMRPVTVGGLAFGGFGVASGLHLNGSFGPVRNGSAQYIRLTSQDPTQPLAFGPSLVPDAVQFFRDGARLQDNLAFLNPTIWSPSEFVGLRDVDGDTAAGAYDIHITTNVGVPSILEPTVHYGTGAVTIEHVDAVVPAAFPFVTAVETKHYYNSTLFNFVAAADGKPLCTATLPLGSPASVRTFPFRARSLEISADATLAPPQTGGTYELLFAL